MATKLDQVLRDIEVLTPDERRKVQEALNGLLSPTPSADAEDLLRSAEELGIQIHLPAEEITDEECDQFKPVSVQGEPVSETIMRERR